MTRGHAAARGGAGRAQDDGRVRAVRVRDLLGYVRTNLTVYKLKDAIFNVSAISSAKHRFPSAQRS